jgi:hypothetical protein
MKIKLYMPSCSPKRSAFQVGIDWVRLLACRVYLWRRLPNISPDIFRELEHQALLARDISLLLLTWGIGSNIARAGWVDFPHEDCGFLAKVLLQGLPEMEVIYHIEVL